MPKSQPRSKVSSWAPTRNWNRGNKVYSGRKPSVIVKQIVPAVQNIRKRVETITLHDKDSPNSQFVVPSKVSANNIIVPTKYMSPLLRNKYENVKIPTYNTIRKGITQNPENKAKTGNDSDISGKSSSQSVQEREKLKAEAAAKRHSLPVLTQSLFSNDELAMDLGFIFN